MVYAALCLCHSCLRSLRLDTCPTKCLQCGSPTCSNPSVVPPRSVRQLWSCGSVAENRLHCTSLNANTLIKTCLKTALFTAYTGALCGWAVGGSYSYCRKKSMGFPRALPVAPYAVCDLYKERLKFSNCKLSVLLLGANFKTMCIFK